ncbi:YwqG family protein [Metabacillus malikii]|uniref:Uncharacterized protein YwqG n=1 Tax=Metabacillus malikii TaxID=1504265 RepID=A0ABT9ZDT6_9BACI|nr:YwqG family protein [Metabacillus malikii]MDQ0230104.1 uncharacterized protein YwqG [Metabacillus malikii]
MQKQLSLPKQLEKYKSIIEKTIVPYIHIDGERKQTGIYQSKFGGNPYFPKNMEYPVDYSGKPMKLLAQINFAEVPHLEPFPEKGILQFFIAAYDDLMGLDFDRKVDGDTYQVIYHEDILEEGILIKEFPKIDEEHKDFCFPFTSEVGLEFSIEYEALGMSDFRAEEQLAEINFDEVIDEEEGTELWDIFAEEVSNDGHKIGGYGFFTQTDPREYGSGDYNILLLQIDTDNSNDIMWGDSGVGNFFIREQDLKNLDFSKVLYNWDCY